MAGKCKLQECAAPLSCHLGCSDINSCENWVPEVIDKKTKKENDSAKQKNSNVNWTGLPFTFEELPSVSARSSPYLIGIVGRADAGKTTFLAMLYTLLLNGKKLKNYDFAGTKTIIGWDQLHSKLLIQKGNVAFPEPTPVNSNRQYHFALRNNNGQLKDLLFSDASGEVFSLWSQDRDDVNAGNARWVYANSNAFMLFIDCQALIDQKNVAKRDIINIAQQLTHNLQGRPVIAVWSKSDKKGEVLQVIRDALKKELKEMFNNYTEIEISNFLEPGPDELVHNNNLEAIDWLLERISSPSMSNLAIEQKNTTDLFLNYNIK
jgi:hypothetical protein